MSNSKGENSNNYQKGDVVLIFEDFLYQIKLDLYRTWRQGWGETVLWELSSSAVIFTEQ